MIPHAESRLRIYLNANDRWHHQPLYQAVVEKARALGLAGASVFRVEFSYGANRELRDARSEYTSFAIPVVVEIIDALDRIDVLVREVGAMITEGLVTIDPVRVVFPACPAAPGPSGGSSMRIEAEAQRLTVYLGSSDTWHGRNLVLAIVERCRELGLAGATATRGVMGFGLNSRLHRAHIQGLSEDLPERIEVVDRPEQIARLLPALEEMTGVALVVLEDVRVIRYLHDPKS